MNITCCLAYIGTMKVRSYYTTKSFSSSCVPRREGKIVGRGVNRGNEKGKRKEEKGKEREGERERRKKRGGR